MRKPLLCLTFLILCAIAQAGRTDILSKAGDGFVVTYPNDFRYEPVSEEGFFPVAFNLHFSDQKDGPQLSFQVLIDKVDNEDTWKDQAALGRFLEHAGAAGLKGAVETSITPVPYQVEAGWGAYCIFTDPSLVKVDHPKAGDFRLKIMGVIRKGAYLFFLKGYSNSTSADYFKKANAVLENIEVLPPK